jgi:hypothetical protein
MTITLPCPAWCTTDHAGRRDDGETREHDVDILRLPPRAGGRPPLAWVWVCVVDDLVEGTRTPAEVGVDLDSPVPPAVARQVAQAMAEAAALAAGPRTVRCARWPR